MERIGPLQHAIWWKGKDLRKPTRSGANLRRANLRGANFQGRALNGSDLSGANLFGANFSATLTGVKFRGADLRGADLFRAFLEDADLTDANLEGAQMEGADLTGAKLTHARLRGATYRARFLIPAGYQGRLRITYGVPGAPVLPTEADGYRVVKFPATGRMETSSPVDWDPPNIDLFFYEGERRWLASRETVHARGLGKSGIHWDQELVISRKSEYEEELRRERGRVLQRLKQLPGSPGRP